MRKGDGLAAMINPLIKKRLIFKSKKEGATRYYDDISTVDSEKNVWDVGFAL